MPAAHLKCRLGHCRHVYHRNFAWNLLETIAKRKMIKIGKRTTLAAVLRKTVGDGKNRVSDLKKEVRRIAQNGVKMDVIELPDIPEDATRTGLLQEPGKMMTNSAF